MRFVQFASQNARVRIPAGVPTSAGAAISFVSGFELVRDLRDVSVKFAKQCSCLSASRVVVHHSRILSPFLNLRISGLRVGDLAGSVAPPSPDAAQNS
jgi:hypothetical protein